MHGWGRALVAVGLVVAAGACGGSDDGRSAGGSSSGGSGGELPAACREAPVTMRLEALTDPPAGDADFEVTDAVARRIPILAGESQSTSDPDELAEQQAWAANTDLALFSIYLADFEIDRGLLEGFGFGDVDPEPGGTIGALAIVPTTEDGFATGDVARSGELEYDVNTTFTSLGLTIRSEEHDEPEAFTDALGRVEILSLDDDTICVDVDVQIENSGQPIAAAEGVIAAPIVRPPDSFYLT
jgi:hypothetical protein